MLVAVDLFLAEAGAYPFLAHAGEPVEAAVLATDLTDALDGWWDGWRPPSLELWRGHSAALRRRARRKLGGPAMGAAFYRAHEVLGGPLWRGVEAYATRQGADKAGAAQAVDLMERDLALAAVERELGDKGFFCELAGWYRAGRWPCGWRDGAFPAGCFVVL